MYSKVTLCESSPLHDHFKSVVHNHQLFGIYSCDSLTGLFFSLLELIIVSSVSLFEFSIWKACLVCVRTVYCLLLQQDVWDHKGLLVHDFWGIEPEQAICLHFRNSFAPTIYLYIILLVKINEQTPLAAKCCTCPSHSIFMFQSWGVMRWHMLVLASSWLFSRSTSLQTWQIILQ